MIGKRFFIDIDVSWCEDIYMYVYFYVSIVCYLDIFMGRFIDFFTYLYLDILISFFMLSDKGRNRFRKKLMFLERLLKYNL